ncbi:MAG TPA: CFI-box-CTERM domain-containing protein [Nitrososphaera sp.]
MRKAPVLSASVIALLLFSIIAIIPSSFAQTGKGPYIDQARFIFREDENLALEEVRNGNLDMYYFRIPLEAAPGAEMDPRLQVHHRQAGSMGLYINPAEPDDSSVINPFQFREVRYAMNFLVDRESIVNLVQLGYGTPMIDAFGVSSPEYLNVIDLVESFGFRYNPALAEKMISDAMTGAGALKQDGKWTYNNSPVTIKMLIRQDDAPRKSLGEIVASELEKLGFAVQKEYGDLNKATTVVYGTNPAEVQWHIYTEGFAGTAVFVEYNPVVPAQMYGPWYGRMPGGQNPAYWNYANATLDKLTQDIFFFNFTSEAERNDLVRKAVQMGVQESVRIFVSQKTDPFVASANLRGLVNDFGAGITSKYSLFNVQPADGKKSLDIGVKQIHQGSWNGIGGLQDTYSRDIYHSIADSGTFRDPYTGEIIPFRAEWTDVSTDGPVNRMAVDPSAQLWDPASQEWKAVGESTSLSKVTFRPMYSNWHNGVAMDVSDMMYSQYFFFEWGTDLGDADQTKDPEFTAQASVAIPLLKGLIFTSVEIQTYIDQWHYNEKEIADSGIYFSGEPWEITAATERLVLDGKAAYSRNEASVKGVVWLDPIVREHADMIKAELQTMKSENFVPAALREVVTPAAAAMRYDASIKWIEDHGHAIISNGAFYLDTFSTAAGTITIKAFRDDSYPFEVGHWSKYTQPRLADITSIDVPRAVVIGQPAVVSLDLEVAGEPSSDATVAYFLSNKDSQVVAQGNAVADTEGRFRFDLPAADTEKLSPGPNQLKIFASSNEARRFDISTSTILASSTPSGNQTGNQTGGPGQTPQQPSGCLIATAAFGSELTPQVQYLRNFREQYILSTSSGAAFMNTFNSVYYSFSPQVADYEREQPWLQGAVKAGLYPLFGILVASERAHFVASGGELGTIVSGSLASMLIGAVYLWPAAVSARVQRRFSTVSRISLLTLGAALVMTVAGLVAGSSGLLMFSTSLIVLSIAAASALAVAWLVRRALGRIIAGKY